MDVPADRRPSPWQGRGGASGGGRRWGFAAPAPHCASAGEKGGQGVGRLTRDALRAAPPPAADFQWLGWGEGTGKAWTVTAARTSCIRLASGGRGGRGRPRAPPPSRATDSRFYDVLVVHVRVGHLFCLVFCLISSATVDRNSVRILTFTSCSPFVAVLVCFVCLSTDSRFSFCRCRGCELCPVHRPRLRLLGLPRHPPPPECRCCGLAPAPAAAVDGGRRRHGTGGERFPRETVMAAAFAGRRDRVAGAWLVPPRAVAATAARGRGVGAPQ